MSRALRIQFKNAWYHVMNRGAAFRSIYLNNKDREKFLTVLETVTKQYDIEIHAYCLMTNHYHLLIKTQLPNLSNAMRYLNSMYARHFNTSHRSDGPIFKGRFKATIVSDDEYLLHVSRYIHLNPQKANMVQIAEDYAWSSCAAYTNNSCAPVWLKTEIILDFFDDNKCLQYLAYMHQDDALLHEIDKKYDNEEKWISVLGNNEFESAIKKNFKQSRKEIVHNLELKKTKEDVFLNIDQIKETVAKHFKVKKHSLKRQKIMETNLPRAVAIFLARTVGKFQLSEISQAFKNHSSSSVSMAIWKIKKKMFEDVVFMQEINQLEVGLEKQKNNHRS